MLTGILLACALSGSSLKSTGSNHVTFHLSTASLPHVLLTSAVLSIFQYPVFVKSRYAPFIWVLGCKLVMQPYDDKLADSRPSHEHRHYSIMTRVLLFLWGFMRLGGP